MLLGDLLWDNLVQELLQNQEVIAYQSEDFVKEKVYPWGLYIEIFFILVK